MGSAPPGSVVTLMRLLDEEGSTQTATGEARYLLCGQRHTRLPSDSDLLSKDKSFSFQRLRSSGDYAFPGGSGKSKFHAGRHWHAKVSERL